MSYLLPFKAGDKLVECGGGDSPMIRPNLDCRASPYVDLVVDFNKPLPVNAAQFDGLFCKFALEHVSYRNVPGFLSECCRILKPGGIAVFITPNTLEQCRVALNTEVWTDQISCLLFGDLDYPENSHKLALSPEYGVRLLKQAGFYEAVMKPWPGAVTDMVLEATKSAAEVLRGLP